MYIVVENTWFNGKWHWAFTTYKAGAVLPKCKLWLHQLINKNKVRLKLNSLSIENSRQTWFRSKCQNIFHFSFTKTDIQKSMSRLCLKEWVSTFKNGDSLTFFCCDTSTKRLVKCSLVISEWMNIKFQWILIDLIYIVL